MKRTATFMVLLLILLAFAWSAPSALLRTGLGQTRHPLAPLALNSDGGPALSSGEGISTGYDLSWFTVAGTVRSTSSRYTLLGTVGQPDLGPMRSHDGTYVVYSGFWSGTDLPISAYLPLIGRDGSPSTRW